MPGPRPIAALAALLVLTACSPPPAPAKPTLTPLLHSVNYALQPTLSSDGAFMVMGDGEDLWLCAWGSETAANLTATFTPAATDPALSPDGAHLAFSAGGALYLAGPRGEHPQRLLEAGREPAFSPDSTHIAFVTDEGLWRTDLAGAAPDPILRSWDPASPAFSPDGRTLAFVGENPAGPGLFLVPVEGGTPRRLAEGKVRTPAWDPANGALWYLASRGDVSALMRQSVAEPGVQAEQVAVVPAGQGLALGVAAGTGRLVLAAVRAEAQIFAAPFDPAALEVTGPPVQITHGLDGARCPQPSPDGHGLAYTGLGEHQDLFLADPDGAHPRALSRGAMSTATPRWTPDGAHLLFEGRRREHDGIWSVDMAGGDIVRLSGEAVAAPKRPVLSPDGTRLAFTADGPQTLLIYLDTEWDHQVHALRDGLGRGWSAAAWSPDGRRLVLTGPGGRLALMDADSLAVTPLEATGDEPLWAPDSQHLLVGTGGLVTLLDPATGATRTLLDLAPRRLEPPTPLALGPAGDRLYLALDLSEADLWLLEPEP